MLQIKSTFPFYPVNHFVGGVYGFFSKDCFNLFLDLNPLLTGMPIIPVVLRVPFPDYQEFHRMFQMSPCLLRIEAGLAFGQLSQLEDERHYRFLFFLGDFSFANDFYAHFILHFLLFPPIPDLSALSPLTPGYDGY